MQPREGEGPLARLSGVLRPEVDVSEVRCAAVPREIEEADEVEEAEEAEQVRPDEEKATQPTKREEAQEGLVDRGPAVGVDRLPNRDPERNDSNAEGTAAAASSDRHLIVAKGRSRAARFRRGTFRLLRRTRRGNAQRAANQRAHHHRSGVLTEREPNECAERDAGRDHWSV